MGYAMRLKHLALAASVLLVSAGAAAADIVTGDLNLRSGPGPNFAIIDTMPAGSHVRVLECGAGWCRVRWRGIEGFASASYLGEGGPVYVEGPPPPVYVAPPVVGYGYAWRGPRYGWRGAGWRYGYRHGWYR
jgi:uncharacterized protein YraI